MKYLAVSAAVLLLLAGCNQPTAEDTADDAAPLNDNGVPVGTDVVVSNESDARASQEVADEAAEQPMGKAFPAAFQGRWGMGAADCTSTRGDDKGLVTVSGDTLRFYESRGIVDTLTLETPTRVKVDLDFTGEGQEWKRSSTYEVVGDTLTRRDTEPSETYRYTRCAA